MITRNFREIVANFDGVRPIVALTGLAVAKVFVDPLASLESNTRRRHVVPTGVIRVYRAVEVVPVGAGQRVLVETFLVCRASAVLVGGVANGELDVSLGSRFVRWGGEMFFFPQGKPEID